MVFGRGVGYFFRSRAGKDFTPEQEVRANQGRFFMRRLLLIAAAAAIALVGLSANQCGGSGEKAAEPKPAEEMPAKPDESMSDDSMSDDSMSGDSMEGETPAPQ
jgi:hypothetical protein